MTQEPFSSKEELDHECETDLKELCNWYGGWKELREVIDRLEQSEKEASYDRAYDPERQ